MHREDTSNYLLYIEPQKEEKLFEPIEDEWTELMETVFNRNDTIIGVSGYSNLTDNESFYEGGGFRGWHTTNCGMMSDNYDHKLFNGMITNSLCSFYLKYYRNSISANEWIKLNKLKNDLSYESLR